MAKQDRRLTGTIFNDWEQIIAPWAWAVRDTDLGTYYAQGNEKSEEEAEEKIRHWVAKIKESDEYGLRIIEFEDKEEQG